MNVEFYYCTINREDPTHILIEKNSHEEFVKKINANKQTFENVEQIIIKTVNSLEDIDDTQDIKFDVRPNMYSDRCRFSMNEVSFVIKNKQETKDLVFTVPLKQLCDDNMFGITEQESYDVRTRVFDIYRVSDNEGYMNNL